MAVREIKVPVTAELRVAEVERVSEFIDTVLALGRKIKNNEQQLINVQDELRLMELKGSFYTIDEIAEAMHISTKKTVIKMLKNRGVEILEYGKTYVVFKENFLNAFREAS